MVAESSGQGGGGGAAVEGRVVGAGWGVEAGEEVAGVCLAGGPWADK
jgi:hypothetical protein